MGIPPAPIKRLRKNDHSRDLDLMFLDFPFTSFWISHLGISVMSGRISLEGIIYKFYLQLV